MAERTLEQLVAALEKADEAGDDQAAQAIAAEIKRRRSAPSEPEAGPETSEPPTRDRSGRKIGTPAAIVHGLTQGATLGFADELAAGGAGLVAALNPRDDKGFREGYRERLTEERENLAGAREAAPWIFRGTEIAGAVAPTARAANAVRGLSALRNVPNWVKVSMLGGAEGAAFGAGTAEGDTAGESAENRAKAAATGGLVGAVAAPVVATAAKPVMSGLRNVGRIVGQKLTSTPRREAERLVSGALRNDAADITSIGRVVKNPNMLLADIGENTSGLARAAAAKPGPFRTAARETLMNRQTGQQGRLLSAARAGGREFKDNFDDWLKARITSAKPKYDEAYATPLDMSSPKMQALLKRPAMQSALRVANTKLQNEGGQRTHVAVLDAAKRALDDKIGVAVRQGKGDDVRILQGIKRQLVSEMDRQVPAYGEARAIFSGESAVKDAAEHGLNLFKRSESHDVMRRLVEDMPEGELQAFRRGAIRGLIDMLETTPENRNAAQKLIESTAVRDKLRLLFKDDKAVEDFMQQAIDESQMSFTKNFILGGSPTARIQEDVKAMSSVGEFIRDAVTGNHAGVFARLLRGIGYGDVSDETLEELSKLLLSRQSPATIRRIGQQAILPPPSSISPTTQAITGGAAGAVAGSAAGRGASGNAERSRRLELAEGLRE